MGARVTYLAWVTFAFVATGALALLFDAFIGGLW